MQNNKKNLSVPVKCAAKFNGEQWVGICLNFDIAVQGKTLSDVETSLKTAVSLYLESFDGVPFESPDALLKAISRPVPWSVSMPIYFSVILHSIVSMLGGKPEDRLSYYNDVNDFCPA